MITLNTFDANVANSALNSLAEIMEDSLGKSIVPYNKITIARDSIMTMRRIALDIDLQLTKQSDETTT